MLFLGGWFCNFVPLSSATLKFASHRRHTLSTLVVQAEEELETKQTNNQQLGKAP